MEYSRFVEEVENLDFIEDEDEADSAVKAVLGVLAGSMDEDEARRLADNLPEPLTYDRLKGRRHEQELITIDEFLSEIGAQFSLTSDQSRRLVDTVFHVMKEAIGEDMMAELEDELPSDIAEELENA